MTESGNKNTIFVAKNGNEKKKKKSCQNLVNNLILTQKGAQVLVHSDGASRDMTSNHS